MAHDDITHLLVVSEGSAAANRLISDLRHAGITLRAANAGTAPELATLLAQDQWDVLVAYATPQLPPETLHSVLQHHQQDIPVILVLPDDPGRDLQALFQHGVRDVLTPVEQPRLLLSVQREAGYYSLKRQLRRLEVSARELEKRHQLLLAASATPVSYVIDGVHLYCNQRYTDCFGYDSTDAIMTTPFLNLVAAGERQRVRELLIRALMEECSATLDIRRQDGSEDVMQLTLTPVDYQGKSCLQASLQVPAGNSDYSNAVAEAQTQDLLTRLDNRSHFLSRIESAIGKAVKQGVFSSLLVVQLNEFVDISSTIGRSNANLVLNDIASFLHDSIGKPYAAARLDEQTFGIMLYDGDPDAALALGNMIQSNINNRISPAMLSSLELSCSIGMALINGHALDANQILARAQANLGTGLFATAANPQFRISENPQPDTADMLDYLKLALQEKRFRLRYQPLVHIKGDGQKRYEVLTRMLDIDGNEVSPAAFLPLAKLNGMGELLDRLVIDMTLAAITKGSAVQGLIINITANALLDGTFLSWLSARLHASRLPADLLTLQLSEIDLHNNLEPALAFCKGLQQLNVRSAISHFGCALEPFTVLDAVRPAFIKLEETLVRDLIYGAHQKRKVQQIIHRLHESGLLVVVPQVEDIDWLPMLWENGVDFVQGHCLQAPSHEMNYEFVQVEEITLTAAP